jgi:hypothetical protein
MPVTFQDDMFGRARPVFDGVPEWLKPFAERIWWLWGDGMDQRIADHDPYLIVKYWITYEGLGAVLGEDALMAFVDWFTATPGPTSPETLRRTRQWLTSRNQTREVTTTPVDPFMPESPDVHQRRARKRQMVTEQMGQGVE